MPEFPDFRSRTVLLVLFNEVMIFRSASPHLCLVRNPIGFRSKSSSHGYVSSLLRCAAELVLSLSKDALAYVNRKTASSAYFG